MSSLHHALEAIHEIEDDLFAVPFSDGTEIVFRLPSYKRVTQYLSLLSLAGDDGVLCSAIYESIFRHVCQNKFIANDSEVLPAGIPETISKLVLFFSGVDSSSIEYTQSLLDSHRTTVNSVIVTMKRSICQAFSGYKYHELDSLNYQQLIEVFVQAEKVLKDAGIISDEGLVIQKSGDKKQKALSIEQMIGKDARAYNQFENTSTGQSLYDDPRYKARLEQEKMRQMRRS